MRLVRLYLLKDRKMKRRQSFGWFMLQVNVIMTLALLVSDVVFTIVFFDFRMEFNFWFPLGYVLISYCYWREEMRRRKAEAKSERIRSKSIDKACKILELMLPEKDSWIKDIYQDQYKKAFVKQFKKTLKCEI